MARTRRLLNRYDPTIYHVMSRTALDGFPITEKDKDFLLDLIRRASSLYFIDVIGFCIMSNHFHLLIRVYPGDFMSDEDLLKRLRSYFGDKRDVTQHQLPFFRNKLSSLSEFTKEIKQSFSRYYNKQHDRSGFFWGQRYKSVMIENSHALLNCLAYIDLNPVRAAIVKQPEDYRWSTLGYLVQTNNKDDLLSLEFGVERLNRQSFSKRLSAYRRFVYEIGSLASDKGKAIDQRVLEYHQKKGFQITSLDRLRFRTRYFSDSGIIGSKTFVMEAYKRFSDRYFYKKEKKPVPVHGIDEIYSLKKLAEG